MNNVASNQLDRLPSQNRGSRRVAFSESLPRHRAASGEGNSRHRSKCCPRLFACCAWICLVVFGIVLAVLILGVIFMSFLQSGLPQITVKMLNLSKFETNNSTNQNNVLLNAKVDVSIEMRNKNDKIELSYSNIVVNLASDDVKLGRSVIPGFTHKPGNTTYFNVTMNVVGASTDKDNVSQLEDDRKRVQMNVQVTMESTVGFHIGIFNLNDVPIHVACDFKQFLLLYRINEPPCNIRMFPTLR
ncbi:uncharacterized protein LOC120083816 [Benincasa hispida]|uniref:uncharacterized protein LOC120083816 n=1 Tax=Benincasa hispida TaxID=102211 RepID=UPI0019026C08|nr:uncharacterized protein LOC120083816 [Benincasa hispida]